MYMRLNKSMVGGFLLGLGLPVALIVGLLVAPASSAATTYTAAEVATHNTQGNCWTIVGGNVYNVTAWIGQHPGGTAPIIALCGHDGTASFNSIHSGSTRAKNALAGYLIGTLAATPSATPTPTPTSSTPTGSYTLAQVAAHGTSGDCWSAINNAVYNLTSWIGQHPGGRTVIIQLCGIDGSGYYNTQHGRSSEAATALRRFLIGTLAPTPTPTATATYTMAQVATHKTQADCWSAINTNVYNLTAWVTKHPGGTTQIVALCGIDGSAAFNGKHSASASAISTLGLYLIGTLSGSSGGGTPPPALTTPYTIAQVATHKTKADCWSAINGVVYNLTSWIPLHPGGTTQIVALCGLDGSASFNGKHSASATAKAALTPYQVGLLSGSGTPAPTGSYVMSQVTPHNTAADCWAVVNGFVYNLTNWVGQHPGGTSQIVAMCGGDGTVAFVTKHSGSATAVAALDSFKIGTLLGWVAPVIPSYDVATLGGNGQYTMDEVAQHGGAGSCWSAIGGSVYDLTSWIGTHPGGPSVITALCGMDGTGSYSGKHGGSASAGAILAKLRIGSLVASKPKPIVQYTMADVAKHNTAADCWSVVNGSVYDLTAWVNKHPGGPAVIIAMCGSDGTAMFTGKHGSSASALSTLGQFQIGFLDSVQVPATVTTASGPIVNVITARSVMTHRTAKNCWTIVNGNVYNLTPWTKRHASHKTFVKAVCGKNGSAVFNKANGSKAKANKKLKRFLIGKVGRPVATTTTSTATGTYTLADVATHNTASNCWSAVNGGVYDLTKWIPLHPGGSGVIVGMCGKDGSASFNSMHKGNAKAAAALAKYSIGKLG
jgi:cytochrome b involved in lipid metabolism